VRFTPFETAPEVAETVVTIVSSTALTLFGLGAEYNAIVNLLREQTVTGLWLLFVGSIVLYMGAIELGYRGLLSPSEE
jgi:hypothetical protein